MLETISFYAMKKLFSIITLPSLGGGGEHPSWGQRGKRKGLFKGNLAQIPLRFQCLGTCTSQKFMRVKII